MSDLLQGWITQLARDLRGFADRGAEPEFETDGNTLQARWLVQGQQREALFTLKTGGRFCWVGEQSDDEPYSAFLASVAMAGFRQLASALLATIPPQLDFVASEAVLEDGFGTELSLLTPAALTGLIDDARRKAEGSSTQLFFLKGDAGAGKTTLLREATRLQAERYLAGDSEFLCLYVPAQRRELSNLRDAFAGELGELRAAFTHDAIASLAREGILVPVIDGFDELLGTAGYGGAFSSLQTFLAELEGFGTLAVSARSAFYDVEFLGRSGARRPSADIRIVTAQVQPWSDEQLNDYLTRDREGRDPAAMTAALGRLSDADRELLSRPFFASQFEAFVAKADTGGTEASLLEHLIDAYITREAGKIVDANDDPVLPVDGHRYLFELAVGEMWENEVRQLSESDLRTIAELVAEEFKLDADQAGQLATKVTSYAGFRPRRGGPASQATFAFEHEVYFDHFLSCAMHRMLREQHLDELVAFLDRGLIPEGVASASVKALARDGQFPASLLRCSDGVSFENRRRNLGRVALAYARDVKPISDTTVRGLSFVMVRAGRAEFTRVRFDGCQFVDVDLSKSVFAECDAETSSFDGLVVDSETRMGIAGMRPGANVRRIHHEAEGDVYAPAAMTSVLERLGTPMPAPAPAQSAYSPHAEDLAQLMQRLGRAFQSTTVVYESDDRRHQALFGSPHWDELRKLLIQHGVISREMRESKGANVPGYRLHANLDELLAGPPQGNGPQSSMAAVWDELRSL